MPLHPQLAAMLRKAAEAGVPPMHTIPVERIRAGDLARYSFGVPKEEVAAVEDRTIPGPGGDIPIRIFTPSGEGPRPVTVFFHGSGFCICSIETHDAMCRQICNRSGSIVVSVDYRLAPENKHPAAVEDAHAATLWAAGHAAEIGGNPERLAVCGDSVGGTLSAIVAQRLRDEGGPALAAQVLAYPVTDHHSVRRPSWEERAEGYGLGRDAMIYFWDQYVSDPALFDDPSVSPLRAESLEGLPPTYLVTAEYDVLRDEGEAYADALEAAGVPVTRHRYGDMNHGFLNWVGLIDRSGEAMDAMGAWMRRTLGG